MMAMAATRVIAEAEHVGPVGEIDANAVHTPGPFVDHVVALGALGEEYQVVRR
jgi:acetate CoA/acetoacetate CoA-transferase alpha subunit